MRFAFKFNGSRQKQLHFFALFQVELFLFFVKTEQKKILFSTMASPFETEGSFLTQEQADHINERHVSRKEL